MKIIFIGGSNVGKTSIVNRLVSNKFYDKIDATIGGAFSTVSYKGHTYNIWDTAGQERYASLIPMYYRNANMAIFVYDISDIVDDEFIDELQSKLFILMHDSPDCHLILVANKWDLIDQEDLVRKMKLVSAGIIKNKIKIYEHIAVSAKTGQGIPELITCIMSVPFVNDNKEIKIGDIDGGSYCCY